VEVEKHGLNVGENREKNGLFPLRKRGKKQKLSTDGWRVIPRVPVINESVTKKR